MNKSLKSLLFVAAFSLPAIAEADCLPNKNLDNLIQVFENKIAGMERLKQEETRLAVHNKLLSQLKQESTDKLSSFDADFFDSYCLTKVEQEDRIFKVEKLKQRLAEI